MDFRKKKKGLKKIKPRTLDEATFNYYSRIANLFNKDEFDNEEDKERCVHSLLKQFSKEGLKVSKEGMVSKLLEKLVTYANIKQFHGLLKNFSEDWESACSDRFASFVAQTLVRHSTKFFVDTLTLQKDCKEFEEEELRQLQQEILKLILDGLIAYLCSKFAFFMQHFSASHVIRAVVEMLAGTNIDDAIICGNKNFQQQQEKPPSHSTVSMRLEIKSMFDEMFLRICSIITSLPKLEDHVCNHLSNPVLQTLILCLKTLPDAKAAPIFKIIIQNTKIFHKEAEDSLPALCSHEVASRFAEQAFKSMPDVMLDDIYSLLFKGHLAKMASSPTANFVLQKLISCSRNKEQFEQMYDEVHPHFESILAINHIEVLVKISEACIKHSCKQMKFVKHISKAFHCHEPESRRCKIAQLLLSLTTYDIFYKLPKQDEDESSEKKDEESKPKMDVEEEDDDDDDDDDDDEVTEDDDALCLPKIQSINIYGSIIVQNLLNFSNTSSIVLSLFELSVEEWKLLCKDPCGCRVVEVFIRSKTVSEKSKDSLYVKLSGNYLDIACDKWGSRVFDALWLNAKQKEKNMITDELNKDPMKLKSDKFGFFIYQKCLNVSQKRRNDGQDKTQNKKMRTAK